jgi:hypothetical protein
MQIGKKYKCKDTGRIGEIIKAPYTNKGEYVIRYEDGTEAPLMPFELDVKYTAIVTAKKVSTNPLRGKK